MQAQTMPRLCSTGRLVPCSPCRRPLLSSLRRGGSPAAHKAHSKSRWGGCAPRVGAAHATSQAEAELVSEAEKFIQAVEAGDLAAEPPSSSLEAQLWALRHQAEELQQQVDGLYRSAFEGLQWPAVEEGVEAPWGPGEPPDLSDMSEARFGELGRTSPQLLQALVAAKGAADAKGWQDFQARVSGLKLTRSRALREAEEVAAALEQAQRREATAGEVDEYDAATAQWDEEEAGGTGQPTHRKGTLKIVLITGFESFNVDLYKKAAVQLARVCPAISLRVFSDRDIEPRRAEVEAALRGADVFFGSLLFDYDQVEWLRERVKEVPVRLVFESSLELMSSTQVGSFQMGAPGQSKGPPPAVKKVLSLFGSGREEDKMVGYLSFLKIGPKLLKFLPGKKVKDLRTWLTVYSYWNQGGLDNVVSMFLYLAKEAFGVEEGAEAQPRPVVETPATGCLHPRHRGYFSTPAEYMAWYDKYGPVRDPAAPTVAVLLYRKHVITDQSYIPELIECMEREGLRPVPIFINGVEAHTVVRDMLTTSHEQQLLRSGQATSPSLKRDAVLVDAVVNTIGFPLVGGPAGTMEGGRQAEVAKAILSTKNVPYVVAAPLLIQDMASWVRDGISGLQSVVLYALPELDGAIDTVPLGGLVGDNIYLVPERVTRLASRLRKWVALRKTPPQERKLAILVYGFPPGVGATGTAALLNVPRSLENILRELRAEGYDLGELAEDLDGEALVEALKRVQDNQRALNEGARGVLARGAGAAEEYGVRAAAVDITPARLKELLTYPSEWGPTEWGPIPFLPDRDVLVQRMERHWGELGRYRGIATSAQGNCVISGLQLGNVFIGVQPVLGVEGDPMRLLFERDLTPHPQYAAFYKWLQVEYGAHAVLHCGMHGTVEWLPGASLGNSGFSWSDVLLGDLPNVYVYACNNPSESIIAKRRGYGTIVSHNVPPYGRAGLYKQLAELRALLQEYREDPSSNEALRGPIVKVLTEAGLEEDCPFDPAHPDEALSEEVADALPAEAFVEYASRLYQYLLVLENRIFSEGLHVLGEPPAPDQAVQYLSAYFGEDLPPEAAEVVAAASPRDSLEEVRARLERIYSQHGAGPSAASSNGTNGSGSSSGSGAHAALVRSPPGEETVAEALRIQRLLGSNTEELRSVVRALNGEYVLPEAGGDLLRDGAGVLPTGRNIHALDPYRMPGIAALDRGAKAADAILQAHRDANGGAWPETVAVNLWGLDSIKTKGESVAIVLAMVGARPVKEGTGRIARFELVQLEELGRPRIDVVCNLSGIFRDSFQNVVELLDDLFQRAAAAEEPAELNFVRKHALAMADEGLSNSAARLFSNPAGDYGSMVNERVGAGNWDDGDELGDTWVSRNAFSYGRGGERGTARPEVLRSLLKTTDRIVQEIDSVEYGLTDIQEYYANTGALKRAAEAAKGPGAKVGCSVIEAFSKEVKPRELEEVLRLEYRSKLLNPKWAEAMAAQGSGGAFEISQRMTAMVGWGATVDFREDWTWDQAAATYALDPEMAAKLRKANPQAFSNVLRRFLEAAGRGMWKADASTLQQLQEMYADMDSELEGITH